MRILRVILKDPKREANALMLEGGLHKLLALFQYDWKALAEQLHRPLAPREVADQVRITRRKGEVKRLSGAPNGNASKLLLNRMAESGPRSLSVLFGDLAEMVGNVPTET